MNQRPSPLGRRGVQPNDPSDLLSDVGFWEIFEHGERVLLAVQALWTHYDPNASPPFHGAAFSEARERTNEMQTMVLGFLEAPKVLRERLGREPSTNEVLRFVRDRLAPPDT